MSIKNLEVPFTFVGLCRHKFTGIIELGFHESGAFVVRAHTTPPGEPRGSFSTSIPISNIKYRRKHRTGAEFSQEGPLFTIYDDWSSPHIIIAPDEIVGQLVAECIANQIPEKK